MDADNGYMDQFDTRHDYPVRESTGRFYLICSTPRSGSHYLGHLLHQTGQFGFPLEYFNRGNLGQWGVRFGTSDLQDTYTQIKRHRTSPTGVFGCKLHYHQLRSLLRSQDFATLFPDARAIFLTRDDLPGQAVSYARAQCTGQWISGITPRRDPVYSRRRIDRCLQDIIRENAGWTWFIAHQGIRFLHLTYEALLADPAGAIRQISALLDMDVPARLTSETQGLPCRQRDAINDQWRERYLADSRVRGPRSGLNYLYEHEQHPCAMIRRALKGLAVRIHNGIRRHIRRRK